MYTEIAQYNGLVPANQSGFSLKAGPHVQYSTPVPLAPPAASFNSPASLRSSIYGAWAQIIKATQ